MSGAAHSEGLLLIWHDVAPEQGAAVRAWYNQEHHFERLDVPGFEEARRFERVSGTGQEMLGMYRVHTPAVLQSAAYLQRLASPSAWTQSVMPHFRRMCRTVCEVSAQGGQANGGFMAAVAAGEGQAPSQAALRSTVQSLPGILRWRVATAAPVAASQNTSESQLRGAHDSQVAWALLVDTDTHDNAAAALQTLRSLASDTALSAVYQLAFCAHSASSNQHPVQP